MHGWTTAIKKDGDELLVLEPEPESEQRAQQAQARAGLARTRSAQEREARARAQAAAQEAEAEGAELAAQVSAVEDELEGLARVDSAATEVGGIPRCSICLADPCAPGEREVSTTACGHTFCVGCLAAATARDSRCPNCRAVLGHTLTAAAAASRATQAAQPTANPFQRREQEEAAWHAQQRDAQQREQERQRAEEAERRRQEEEERQAAQRREVERERRPAELELLRAVQPLHTAQTTRAEGQPESILIETHPGTPSLPVSYTYHGEGGYESRAWGGRYKHDPAPFNSDIYQLVDLAGRPRGVFLYWFLDRSPNHYQRQPGPGEPNTDDPHPDDPIGYWRLTGLLSAVSAGGNADLTCAHGRSTAYSGEEFIHEDEGRDGNRPFNTGDYYVAYRMRVSRKYASMPAVGHRSSRREQRGSTAYGNSAAWGDGRGSNVGWGNAFQDDYYHRINVAKFECQPGAARQSPQLESCADAARWLQASVGNAGDARKAAGICELIYEYIRPVIDNSRKWPIRARQWVCLEAGIVDVILSALRRIDTPEVRAAGLKALAALVGSTVTMPGGNAGTQLFGTRDVALASRIRACEAIIADGGVAPVLLGLGENIVSVHFSNIDSVCSVVVETCKEDHSNQHATEHADAWVQGGFVDVAASVLRARCEAATVKNFPWEVHRARELLEALAAVLWHGRTARAAVEGVGGAQLSRDTLAAFRHQGAISERDLERYALPWHAEMFKQALARAAAQ